MESALPIYSLTYISTSNQPSGRDVYQEIAIQSSAFNNTNEITGILLIHNDTVIQFLEGDESEVNKLYGRIESDSRHKNPILLSTRHLNEREFADWSMGYENVSSLSTSNFLFPLNKTTILSRFPKQASKISKVLIHSYKQSSGLISA